MIGHPLNRQLPFGRTTERFFVEGEQHEAQQWQDVNLPPDDEPEPKRRRGSIDKVPRQRGAMVALALFTICLMLGLGVGVSALLKTGNRLDTFLSLFKTSPLPSASVQARPASPTTSQPMRPQVTPLPSELSQTRLPPPPSAPPINSPNPPTPSAVPPSPGPVPVPAIVQPAPPPAAKPLATPKTSQNEGLAQERRAEIQADGRALTKAERATGESGAKRKAYHRRHAHEDYVWSPEANALVPSTSTGDTSPTTGAATATANSPRKESSNVQRQSPPDRDELSPPRLRESTIAPATTGTPAAERPAPKPADDVDPFQK